jgi:predicted DNA-binding transcriptional regulator AlpA
MKLLTREDIAALLHIKPATVHDRLYRHPEKLPPRIKIPGSSKPLWLEEDVIDWLRKLKDA